MIESLTGRTPFFVAEFSPGKGVDYDEWFRIPFKIPLLISYPIFFTLDWKLCVKHLFNC